MNDRIKPSEPLESGSLAEYIFDSCSLAKAEELFSNIPTKADLISWDLTQDSYKQQVQLAIDWIRCEE